MTHSGRKMNRVSLEYNCTHRELYRDDMFDSKLTFLN